MRQSTCTGCNCRSWCINPRSSSLTGVQHTPQIHSSLHAQQNTNESIESILPIVITGLLVHDAVDTTLVYCSDTPDTGITLIARFADLAVMSLSETRLIGVHSSSTVDQLQAVVAKVVIHV
jgi:hypothetical protein